jgi:hypothetical protein
MSLDALVRTAPGAFAHVAALDHALDPRQWGGDCPEVVTLPGDGLGVVYRGDPAWVRFVQADGRRVLVNSRLVVSVMDEGDGCAAEMSRGARLLLRCPAELATHAINAARARAE